MRKAAGIILIVLGAPMLGIYVDLFVRYDSLPVGLGFGILIIIWAVFAITGGILCLKRRYWGLCLASALVAVFIGISGFSSSNWLSWFVILGGIVSTIFISGTKKEWQKSQT